MEAKGQKTNALNTTLRAPAQSKLAFWESSEYGRKYIDVGFPSLHSVVPFDYFSSKVAKGVQGLTQSLKTTPT